MAVERPPQGAGVEVQDHDRAMADVGEIDVSSVEPEVVVKRLG